MIVASAQCSNLPPPHLRQETGEAERRHGSTDCWSQGSQSTSPATSRTGALRGQWAPRELPEAALTPSKILRDSSEQPVVCTRPCELKRHHSLWRKPLQTWGRQMLRGEGLAREVKLHGHKRNRRALTSEAACGNGKNRFYSAASFKCSSNAGAFLTSPRTGMRQSSSTASLSHDTTTEESVEGEFPLSFTTREALRPGWLQSVCYRVQRVWRGDEKSRTTTKSKTEQVRT